MATLKIRKSENEFIELPLTTTKPLARSLAVFQNGKVYYCPLVHSGEYLDSGVKVRIGSATYALATQIYDPVTYNSSGRMWGCYGLPNGRAVLHSRNHLVLNAGNYLAPAKTVTLSSSSSFSFSCSFLATDFSTNRYLFDCYITSTKRFILYIDTSKKLLLRSQTTSSNAATIKTLASTLNSDDMYSVTVSYDNGVWTTIFDGTESTVSKSIPAGEYYTNIGARYDASGFFAGELRNLSFSFNGANGRFRFGD